MMKVPRDALGTAMTWGIAGMTSMIWARAPTAVPIAMALNRPIWVSALMAPQNGITYAY